VPPWVASWGPQQGPDAPPTQPVEAGGGPVALLLPQSGPLAPAGAAVHEAFGSDNPTTAYNVSGSPQDTLDAFHHALSDGAGMVVGPLRKEDAAAIATSVSSGTALPIPVIALNYLDANQPPPPGLIQFGLAPEDEAQSAAADAYARGLRRAVILSAQGDWGDRIAAAFRHRFEALGGKIVDEGRYTTGTSDFSAPIKALLKLDAAEARYRSLQSILHVKMEYEPRRRGDVDAIFLGARATQARLITPQLRYYRAEHLPIYATSSAYDGTIDADLLGVRFCDVPSLVGSALPSGQSVDLVRLAALGRDAAQLGKALRLGPLTGTTTFEGAAGLIYVGGNGVVRRQLACAEFNAGGVHPLGAPEVSVAP
jgi:outer membrane PBP1 activator LpoA protein